MRCTVFCPAHITGFFEPILIKNNKAEFSGSIGAGFSIKKGITTTANIRKSNKTCFNIHNTGYKSQDDRISIYIIKKLLNFTSKKYFIDIKYDIPVPIGYGLGCSGAVALSLALALNNVLDLKLSKKKIGEIAHNAEIKFKTGLGDVIATYYGGFEIRTKCGAPGIGLVKKITLDRSMYVIIICFAPMPTNNIITKVSNINGLGVGMINKLILTQSSDDFQDMSIEFAKKLKIVTPKMDSIIYDLHKNGIKCGVAFFGETVFSIINKNMIKKAINIMKKYNGEIIRTRIDNIGARVIR